VLILFPKASLTNTLAAHSVVRSLGKSMQPNIGVTRLVKGTPTRGTSSGTFTARPSHQLGMVVKVSFKQRDRLGCSMQSPVTELARFADPVRIAPRTRAGDDSARRGPWVKEVTFDLDARFTAPPPLLPRFRGDVWTLTAALVGSSLPHTDRDLDRGAPESELLA
jgi:hypothetical protein